MKQPTPEYAAWAHMRNRCNCPTDKAYRHYGGRGITVCESWDSFANFLVDMGKRPSDLHELDRYPNNDGNYEKGNCRWATRTQQMRNTRITRFLEHDGRRLSIAEWAEILGISAGTIRVRLHEGKSVAAALAIPRYKHPDRKVTFGGETLSVTEWARRLGAKQTTISARLSKGLSVEKVLAPVIPRRRIAK